MKLPFTSKPAPPRRHPTKSGAFAKLKALGVPVGAILDVGVNTCTSELILAFPDKHHVLMEPVVEWNESIRKNYSRSPISHEILNVAVSDRDGETVLKVSSVYADKAISHSQMVDDAKGAGRRVVPMRTLDTIVAERALEEPYLLKIDVDGAEMAVLAGAKKTLDACSVIVIETGINNLVERAAAVEAAGFQIFDIVDLCYYDDRFVQADMVFLSQRIIRRHKLAVYAGGFDVSKWSPYRPG